MARSVPRGAPMHFVLNGAAGDHKDAEVLQVLAKAMGESGRHFELHRAAQPAALADTAREAAAQAGENGVVVAIGGDGTINTVASVLIGTPVTLGLVPRGTFNYAARSHGIPLELAEAAGLLLNGRAHAVQVGRVNERCFVVNASLGLYPELLQDREAFKKRYGRTRLVALGAALRSLLRVHPRLSMQIQAEGRAARELRVSTLFVGNNALQLQTLGLPEAEQAGRSALAALALRAFKPGELLWLAARGALGRLGEADEVTHFSFRDLTVQPRMPLRQRLLKVAIDGEVTHLRPPLRFAVDERPLWLIRPDAEVGAGADDG